MGGEGLALWTLAGLAVLGTIVGVAGIVFGRTLHMTNNQLRTALAEERETRAAADASNIQLKDDNQRITEQNRILTQALATGPDIQRLVDEIRAMASAVVSVVARDHRQPGGPS